MVTCWERGNGCRMPWVCGVAIATAVTSKAGSVSAPFTRRRSGTSASGEVALEQTPEPSCQNRRAPRASAVSGGAETAETRSGKPWPSSPAASATCSDTIFCLGSASTRSARSAVHRATAATGWRKPANGWRSGRASASRRRPHAAAHHAQLMALVRSQLTSNFANLLKQVTVPRISPQSRAQSGRPRPSS